MLAARRQRGISLLGTVILLLLLVAVVLWWRGDAPIEHPPGVLVAEAPTQRELDVATAPWEHQSHTITPLFVFELRARVLSRADYRFDEGADLVPTDLALGWGRMSDSAVLSHLDISQGGRWWRYATAAYPIAQQEIQSSAANMHLIPANDRVADALARTRTGDIVRLRGYLVEATRHDTPGWRWTSSVSRTDTGGGSCELIWVDALDVLTTR
jgi:hypothetical protein